MSLNSDSWNDVSLVTSVDVKVHGAAAAAAAGGGSTELCCATEVTVIWTRTSE